MRYTLGADIGGTFTDIILLRADGRLFSKKVLSTPDDYSRGIEEGVAVLLEEVGVSARDIAEFAHGELGRFDMAPNHLAAAHQSKSTDQLMCFAAQPLKQCLGG